MEVRVTPGVARRPHGDRLGCWCNPFANGAQVIHLDDAVPPGHGWAVAQAEYDRWAQGRTSPDYAPEDTS